MTTALATINSTPAVPALPAVGNTPSAAAMAGLESWSKAASTIGALLNPLVGSALIPLVDAKGNSIKYEVAQMNAIVKAMYGLSLGLDPITSQQWVYTVPGRAPSLYARMKVALLQARGYDVRVLKLTDDECVMTGHRPGGDDIEPVEITMAMAKRAGWTRNAKYTETPRDMLYARCASRVCEQIGADVLMGLGTVETLDDDEPIRTEASVGTPRRITAADLAPAELTAAAERVGWRPAEPGETPGQVEPDDAPATDPQAETVIQLDDTTAPAAISGEQRARLSELLAATNRRGQSAARKYIKDTIGREVASPADLTADEAENLIGQLDAETDANQPQAGEPA